MDSKGCWLIQIEGGCGTACVYAWDMLASPVWCNCVIALSCFSFLFGKKVVHHTNTNYINLPLFLSESSLYRWPVFQPQKPMGIQWPAPGAFGQVWLPIQWWPWWCRTQWWPWWWGVQAMRVFDECWSIGSQFRSKGMHGTIGHCHHSFDLDLHPGPATSRIITSLVGNPYKPCHCYRVWGRSNIFISSGHWDWLDRCRHGSCGRGSEGTKKERNWFAWGPRG